MSYNPSAFSNSTKSLQLLAKQLIALRQDQRGAAMQSAVGFCPEHSPAVSFNVGPLRAAFSSFWESATGSPVPIQALRIALEPPIPIGTVLEFSRLTIAASHEETEAAICHLLTHLQSRLRELRPSGQLPLFSALQLDMKVPIPSRQSVGGTISNLSELVVAGKRYPTIYADPPWAYDNEASRAAAVNHYVTMSVAEICREPVRELAEQNAHLHLWTTNGFLRQAFEVIDAWGFEFKSCLVWVKDAIGMGNYWRVSHEFLLLGVRGSLTFRDRSISSWVQAPRTVHSRKPGRIRVLIERVSPGPYLELYGREELPDSAWTVFGNQVEKRLF